MPASDPATAATAVAGALFGFSLIVAIGAQNAFVLRQGLRREHVGTVVALCAGSDLVLIAAGTAGLGAVVARSDAVLTVVRWGGAAVLLAYAARAAWRALPRGAEGTLHPAGARPPAALGATVVTTLALTWLNPHVYLDTVLLLGSVAAGHGGQRWAFAAGAGCASVVWFVGLGYGARLLAPLFARPVAWRVLDGVVAVVMVLVAVSLVLR
ncbi:LysE/ArgO family amino acid transporter [Luteimicrobium subarcticum]|uniref:L-lysine exporter family protein LysE/ArgO n=1 Tax=Luteimicrobium subarcticum TaxID=620910 RepID=A0A2M8WUL9_9MICO|nr:LysE family transporter [Luteimicrobium subarcticum]PJI94556.1 L-lysine exporter family protein LysE/ArgO [Luteimicrobium subarcticum]